MLKQVLHALMLLGLLTMAFGGTLGQAKKEDAEILRLVKRVDSLKESDYERLEQLGDPAFHAFLPLVQRRLKYFLAHRRDPGFEIIEQKLRNATWALCFCAKPQHTRAVTALYGEDRGISGNYVFDWMATKGDFTVNRNMFLKMASRPSADRPYWDRRGPHSVSAIVRSGDAKAVSTLAHLLESGKCDEDVRNAIFCTLAKTGQPDAIKAVKNAIVRERTLPPLRSRVRLSDLGFKVGGRYDDLKALHTDSNATVWGLAQRSGLGCSFELWVVKEHEGKWTDPVFTGWTTYWPHSLPSGTPMDGYEKKESELKELIDQNGWIEKCIGKRDLGNDSDGDGYSDIVERWLGLDPANPDTDGDGIQDGVDRNPFVAARPLGDSEKAIEAAFASVMYLEPGSPRNVIVTYPKNMAPFELTVWKGMVIPEAKQGPNAFREHGLFGLGVEFGDKREPAIKFSKDHRSAEIVVGIDGGYYWQGRIVFVRKFGDTWLPVGVKSTWSAIS